MFNLMRGLALVVLVSGCTHTFQPRPDTFKIDAFTEFDAPVDITVINTQTDATDRPQLNNMGHTFSGNLKAWTDAAVTIAERELTARRATIVDGADKRLELSIIAIEGEAGFTAIHYVTRLRVVTGSGYDHVYIGDNRSPATVYRAADGAVMRAVAAMFRDPAIVEYITAGTQ